MRYSEEMRHSQEGIFLRHGGYRPYFPLRDPAEVADKGAAGRFVWHELFTKDAQLATDFYMRLFDWQATEPEGEGELIRLQHADGGEVAGVVQLEPDQDLPAQWVPAVAVQDLETSADRSEKLGADVPVQGDHLAPGEKLGLIRDPQGALVAPMQDGATDRAARDLPPGPVGGFTWHELITPAAQEQEGFYARVFDWQLTERDMKDKGSYRMFTTRDRPVGGLVPAVRKDSPAFWLSYVQVDDAAKVLRRTELMGGTVHQGVLRLPDGKRYALLADPTGASFGVVEASTNK